MSFNYQPDTVVVPWKLDVLRTSTFHPRSFASQGNIWEHLLVFSMGQLLANKSLTETLYCLLVCIFSLRAHTQSYY